MKPEMQAIMELLKKGELEKARKSWFEFFSQNPGQSEWRHCHKQDILCNYNDARLHPVEIDYCFPPIHPIPALLKNIGMPWEKFKSLSFREWIELLGIEGIKSRTYETPLWTDFFASHGLESVPNMVIIQVQHPLHEEGNFAGWGEWEDLFSVEWAIALEKINQQRRENPECKFRFSARPPVKKRGRPEGFSPIHGQGGAMVKGSKKWSMPQEDWGWLESQPNQSEVLRKAIALYRQQDN